MSEHEQAIVAAVLQRSSRLLEIEALSPDAFRDANARRLLSLAREYREHHQGRNSLDFPLARALLERKDSKKTRSLLSFLEELATLETVSDAEFRDAVSRVVGARRRTVLKDEAAKALEASLRGEPEVALAAHRRALIGAEERPEDRPTDLRAESSFNEAKAILRARPKLQRGGFDVGLPFLSERASFRRGDLTIVGGYAKDGKTALAATMALNACLLSGARVLYVSLEMDRDEMAALLISKHAASIDPIGVRWAKIIEGDATRGERRLYARALLDFVRRDRRPDESELERPDGGTIIRWCPRRRPTLGQFADRVRALAVEERIDVVVGDYLELFIPDRRSGQHRLDLTEMCYQTKELAIDAKVWTIMCHQISRNGRDAAEKRSPRHYVMRDLGESGGVERAANQIPWIFSDEVLRSERRARVGMAANRRGEPLVKGIEVFFDPSRAVLAPVQE